MNRSSFTESRRSRELYRSTELAGRPVWPSRSWFVVSQWWWTSSHAWEYMRGVMDSPSRVHGLSNPVQWIDAACLAAINMHVHTQRNTNNPAEARRLLVMVCVHVAKICLPLVDVFEEYYMYVPCTQTFKSFFLHGYEIYILWYVNSRCSTGKIFLWCNLLT